MRIPRVKFELKMTIEQIEYLMNRAIEFSKNSPDAQTKVGAILIDESGNDFGYAFNNFLRGSKRDKLPNTRPKKYTFIQHAERNLLFSCLACGQKTYGRGMVCTLAPCEECLRASYQSGIQFIIYKDEYLAKPVDYENLADINIKKEALANGLTLLVLRPGNTLSDEEVERRVNLIP